MDGLAARHRRRAEGADGSRVWFGVGGLPRVGLALGRDQFAARCGRAYACADAVVELGRARRAVHRKEGVSPRPRAEDRATRRAARAAPANQKNRTRQLAQFLSWAFESFALDRALR